MGNLSPILSMLIILKLPVRKHGWPVVKKSIDDDVYHLSILANGHVQSMHYNIYVYDFESTSQNTQFGL